MCDPFCKDFKTVAESQSIVYLFTMRIFCAYFGDPQLCGRFFTEESSLRTELSGVEEAFCPQGPTLSSGMFAKEQ
jgi:hypothetical protein